MEGVRPVLTSQGLSATGGTRNYVAGSNMTLDYALAAVPSEYGRTGNSSYIISNNGTIFEEDYGTSAPAVFDTPFKGWSNYSDD
jgi:hypothetical protein